MGYKKAVEVLPDELLVLIQDYIDGEYIYIPRKEDNKKSWGEKNKAKQITHVRNSEIYKKYQAGYSIKELAEMYCLSTKEYPRYCIKNETKNSLKVFSIKTFRFFVFFVYATLKTELRRGGTHMMEPNKMNLFFGKVIAA